MHVLAKLSVFLKQTTLMRFLKRLFAVLAVLAMFFLGMLNFVTRPFDLLAAIPADGQDLNPLLQNYWMAIHPPSLYTGYVSASVPFAFGGDLENAGNLRPGWRFAAMAIRVGTLPVTILRFFRLTLTSSLPVMVLIRSRATLRLRNSVS